jgi:DNA-binding SARP family transcriptional activator
MTLASPRVRIHLAGRLSVEVGECRIDQGDFPGQQGRVAFALLVVERSRPVGRAELVDALWPTEAPSSCDVALNAIMSKLRTLLAKAGLDGGATLVSSPGCYELRLPSGTWVDLEAAADAIHEAETALRTGNPACAYGPSAVAHHIARRPLLPGAEGPWLDVRRQRLRNTLLRALECRAEVYLWNAEHHLAIEAAQELVSVEPLRESGHRLLIRALSESGNAAEALQAYERCRRLIAEELGVDPSRQTKAVYESVLASL